MNEPDVDNMLKNHYTAKKLSPESLARMRTMAEKEAAASGSGSLSEKWQTTLIRLGRFLFGKPVVTVCVLLLSLGAWHMVSTVGRMGEHLPAAVAREITMNHHKNLALEFAGIPIQDLGRVMAKLDFTPVMPELLKTMPLTLKGARYCSIQGNLAVQFQFTDPSGSICTLYQTKAVAPLSTIHDMRIDSDGIGVRLWQEKGLFMGIAGITEDMPLL